MTVLAKPLVAVLATALVFSLGGTGWCSGDIDADTTMEDPQDEALPPPSIRTFIEIQSRAQDAVGAQEIAATEWAKEIYLQEWRQGVVQMHRELAMEVQRAREDAVVLQAANLLDMAANLLMKAAESRANWEAEAGRASGIAQSGAEGGATDSGYLDQPGVRRTTTKTIEVCTTHDEPCRVIGIEKLIEVWFAKGWKDGTIGQEEHDDSTASAIASLRQDISGALREEFPEGVVCWNNGSLCEPPSEVGSIPPVESDGLLEGVEEPESANSSPEPVLSSSDRGVELRRRLASILWEVADWTTPVPDLVVLLTGRNPITDEEEARAGAAVSAVMGLGGPVGRMVSRGGKLVVKGGKIFFGGKVWGKGNKNVVESVIGNIHGRTGREAFGELAFGVGANQTFDKLGYSGIRKALSRTPFIWERHAILRLLERRTSRMGISTPGDIVKMLNSGTIHAAGNGMIAIQSPNLGAEILIELGSRSVKTVRPLKLR
ncbi:MAG: hypothetical protein OXQ29_23315 [Rhodospirillaceae bacterium]|nr:hypothetical protein [Rhodospirillaceae bacterium]